MFHCRAISANIIPVHGCWDVILGEACFRLAPWERAMCNVHTAQRYCYTNTELSIDGGRLYVMSMPYFPDSASWQVRHMTNHSKHLSGENGNVENHQVKL